MEMGDTVLNKVVGVPKSLFSSTGTNQLSLNDTRRVNRLLEHTTEYKREPMICF